MADSRKDKGKNSPPEVPVVIDREHCIAMGRTCVAYNLRRAARLVSQVYDQALKPTGLKVTQFSLLVAFVLVPDSKMTQLAKWLGMDRTTLSRNLRVLEKRGLVELEQGQQDRRKLKVRLTPEGEKVFEQACPLWLQAQEKAVGGIGQDRWAALTKELRSLVAGLE